MKIAVFCMGMYRTIALFLLVLQPVIHCEANERLNRGLVAIHQGEKGVYLSWRLLKNDPEDIAFNIYRNEQKITVKPITKSTNYVDSGGNQKSKYKVTPISKGIELDSSQLITTQKHQFKEIRLSPPTPFSVPGRGKVNYRPGEASVGDLDGDGEYELVLKWDGVTKDVSQNGFTCPTIFEALKLSGESLWRIQLGLNIRAGAHYTPFLVFDLDGDGIAEVALRTSDGTVDGSGRILGKKDQDYRDSNGRLLRAPEYLTVFNGRTGSALYSTEFEPARGKVSSWGDNYGNRSERHLACVAYLDGLNPSIVMGRGYYRANPGRTSVAAWDFSKGKLKQRWKFDTLNHPELDKFIGQGTHSIAAGDVDQDGKDEILYGAMAIDNDGQPLYSTNFGHGDAHHFSDLDPSKPLLEFFMPHENAEPGKIPGVSFRDARTGSVLWSIPVERRADIGRAACADIYDGSPGAEAWMSGSSKQWGKKYAKMLFNCQGKVIGPAPHTLPNFFVWWDGDPTREILNKNWIAKYDPTAQGALRKLLIAEGCKSINGSKATPVISADIFGDWREEVIWVARDELSLRIFTTTIPTGYKLPTLMHDRIYRLSVAWQNVAYNQPPHPSFDLKTRILTFNRHE